MGLGDGNNVYPGKWWVNMCSGKALEGPIEGQGQQWYEKDP